MKIRTLICVILAVFLMGACCACGNESSGESDGSNVNRGAGNYKTDEDAHYVEGTLHKISVTEVDRAFVTDGASDYVIVNGASAGKAPGFISGHINAASGVRLRVVDENEVLQWDQSKKYIFVGSDKWFREAGLTMPQEDLGISGYYIKTKGNSVFLQAPCADGYQLAAIRFLNIVAGYDCYHIDAYSYDKDCATLPDIEVTERPDYDYRRIPGRADADTTYAMGWTPGNIWIAFGGETIHNANHILPTKTYYDAHPKWYADNESVDAAGNKVRQLCFTTHGDTDKEREAFIDELTDILIEAMIQNPNMHNVTVTQADAGNECACEACVASIEKYGSISASYIQTMNCVVDNIQEYITSGKGQSRGIAKTHDFNVQFLAYHGSLRAPVVADASGNYVPVDDSVICTDHLGVICAQSSADYTKSFYTEESAAFADNVRTWSAVCSQMFAWTYDTCFTAYMYPYNSWEANLENLRFFKENEAVWIFANAQYTNPYPSSFMQLKTYMQSKASIDVNLKYEDMKNKFFTNYFGPAKDTMLEMFNAEQMYYERVLGSQKNGVQKNLDDARYWQKGFLDSLLDLVDKAYSDIRPLYATDRKLYDALRLRINVESLFPRYALISLYSSYFAEDVLYDMKVSFKNDFEALGNANIQEHHACAETWASWGV